jgi:hypothetical protein
MRRLLPIALLFAASALPAQGFFNSSVRLGPQFHSYDIKAPFNEKITEMAVPLVAIVPVLPALTVDVGTAFAMVKLDHTTLDASGNATTTTSEKSGLTDTQIRANYSVIPDFLVVTAGVNIPTGSATVDATEMEVATRMGSDFLTFPISGFGSGLGFTGGVAVARPAGAWNFGFGASLRQGTEFEPFRDASGTPYRFKPGPEYRARIGADRPFGTGRMGFGVTYSKFGDDKANTTSYNTGDRYIGQFSMSSELANGVDYSFVLWNLYRTSGTLIDQSSSPSGNITNAQIAFGVRGPGDTGVEPSIETRVWTQEGSKTSALATLGMRFYVNRGMWSVVPGFGFSLGTMEGATLNGFRASLGMRFGS